MPARRGCAVPCLHCAAPSRGDCHESENAPVTDPPGLRRPARHAGRVHGASRRRAFLSPLRCRGGRPARTSSLPWLSRLQPPVWSSDLDHHHRWCLRVSEEKARAEGLLREEALRRCVSAAESGAEPGAAAKNPATPAIPVRPKGGSMVLADPGDRLTVDKLPVTYIGPGPDYHGVSGSSPTDVWVAGMRSTVEGVILHYDGSSWSDVTPTPSVPSSVPGWAARGATPGSSETAPSTGAHMFIRGRGTSTWAAVGRMRSGAPLPTTSGW